MMMASLNFHQQPDRTEENALPISVLLKIIKKKRWA